jgi:hypothetical protein
VTTGNVNTPDDGIGYVRGGGVEIDRRRAGRVVLVCCVVVLVGSLIGFTAAALSSNARMSRLKAHGVPVEVTVTSCIALSSGTGETVTGYTCRGSFTLDGRRYTDVIGGTTLPHRVGQTLRGVSDPQDPALLSTARAVAVARPAWQAFIVPAITLVVLILVGVLVYWRWRRARRLAGPDGGVPDGGAT